MQSQGTAILYFTRSAREEAGAKVFCKSGNFAQNKAIAESLIHHTYQQLQKSEFPVKIFSAEHQIGDTFGDKLANAFQSLFDDGFQNVIAVGNDCPALTAAGIRKAGNLLKKNDAVFGPAADGGIYLLGMNLSAFSRQNFQSLAWKTPNLFENFKTYCRQAGIRYCQLQLLNDIDDERSLWIFLQKFPSPLRMRAVNLLLSIYSSAVNYFLPFGVQFRSYFIQSAHSYRGPPVS